MGWIIAGLITGIVLWLLMLAWNLYNYSGYYSLHSTSPMPLTRTPRVSILVPARNEAAMLPSTLPGLLQQDYPDYEVVLVDDGSSDGTGDVAERIALAARQYRCGLEHGADFITRCPDQATDSGRSGPRPRRSPG